MTATLAAKPSLTLVRRLRGSPAKVYAAWTDPAVMAQWFGPHQCTITHAEADVRVGGRFRVIMAERDGTDVHNVSGVYREVEPERKLVFTWAWITTPERESLVTVSLRPVEDGVELTLHHAQFFDEAARDGHNGGWSQSLDKLERLFA